jgi:SAM-dependent methyltransferase
VPATAIAPAPRPGARDAAGRAELAALAATVSARYAGASRFARGFVEGKLRHDPATPALLRLAARRPFGAVVDLGCGRGQLGLALLAAGLAERLSGLDRDAAKLAEARAAAKGLPADFAEADLAAPGLTLPPCDTLLMVDVLYQLPEAAQRPLLAAAARAARRRVLLRAFDPGRGWRSAAGYAMEVLGRAVRGDRNAIRPLPLPAVAAPFEAAGFAVSVSPCWGNTPLPNVLLVAERAAA